LENDTPKPPGPGSFKKFEVPDSPKAAFKILSRESTEQDTLALNTPMQGLFENANISPLLMPLKQPDNMRTAIN
jgi:hypothetical protein